MKPMMSQKDIEYVVLHAQAKAIKRNAVEVMDGKTVYSLSKGDARLLTQLGVSVVEIGGKLIKLVDKVLVETSRTWTTALPKAPEKSDKPVKKTSKTEKSSKANYTDLLMWVGAKHYPYIGDFMKEARKVGCSKRIGKLQQSVEPGKTRVFLAHDEGISGQGFIFGYFIVSRIEIIVKSLDDLPENFTDKLTPVTMEQAHNEQVRGCGWRDVEGAMYMVSETDASTLKAIAEVLGIDTADISGGVVELTPPRSYFRFIGVKSKHFRGALKISVGEDLIRCQDPKFFKSAPSTVYKKPKKEPSWNEKDDKRLAVLIKERKGSMSKVFAIFAFKTGRTKSKVAYHYNHSLKESDSES